MCAQSVNRTLNIALPEATRPGDLVILVVNYTGNNTAPSPPVGWNKIINGMTGTDRPERVASNNGSFGPTWVYYKIWQPGDITSYYQTYASGTATMTGCFFVYSNVDQQEPIDFHRIHNPQGTTESFPKGLYSDVDMNTNRNLRFILVNSNSTGYAPGTDINFSDGTFVEKTGGVMDLSGRLIRVFDKRFCDLERNFAHNLFPYMAMNSSAMYLTNSATVGGGGYGVSIAPVSGQTDAHYAYIEKELEVGTYTWHVFLKQPYAASYTSVRNYLTVVEPDNNEYGSWFGSGTGPNKGSNIGTGFFRYRGHSPADVGLTTMPQWYAFTINVTKPGVHKFKYGLGPNNSETIVWTPGLTAAHTVFGQALLRGENMGPIYPTSGTPVEPGEQEGLIAPYFSPSNISAAALSFEIRANNSPTIPTYTMRLPNNYTSAMWRYQSRLDKTTTDAQSNDDHDVLYATRGFNVLHPVQTKVYFESRFYRVGGTNSNSAFGMSSKRPATGLQQGFEEQISGNVYAAIDGSNAPQPGASSMVSEIPVQTSSSSLESYGLTSESMSAYPRTGYLLPGAAPAFFPTYQGTFPTWHRDLRGNSEFTIGVGLDWDAKTVSFYKDGCYLGQTTANIGLWTHGQIHPYATGYAVNVSGQFLTSVNFTGPFNGRMPAGFKPFDWRSENLSDKTLSSNLSSIDEVSGGTSDQTVNVNLSITPPGEFRYIADIPAEDNFAEIDFDSNNDRKSSTITVRGKYRRKGTYDQMVAADGAIAYWKMDETSGTTATDSIGGYHGTYVGTPTFGQAEILTGWSGQSVLLPTSSYVQVDTPPAFDGANDWTLEFWASGSNNPGTLFSVNSTLGDYGSVIYANSGGFVRPYIRNTSNGTLGSYGRLGSGPYHIVCIYKAATRGWILYVNGRVPWESGGSFCHYILAAPAATFSGAWWLGGDYRTGGQSWLNNRLGHVAAYNRALTHDEVRFHFSKGRNGGESNQVSTNHVSMYAHQVPDNYQSYQDLVNADNPVDYWQLDGNTNNSVSGGNNLIEVNNPNPRRRSLTKLHSSKAYGFTKFQGEYLYGTHRLPTATSFTIEVWFRESNPEYYNIRDCIVVACDGLDSANHSFWMNTRVYNGSGYTPAWFTYSASNSTYTLRDNKNLSAYGWERHAALTYDHATRIVRAYFEGAQTASATMNNVMKPWSPVITVGAAQRYNNPSNSWAWMWGHAAHVSIHNTVLSGARIAERYAKGMDHNWGQTMTYPTYYINEIPTTFRWT